MAGCCDNGNETSWSRKGRNFSVGQELCFMVMVVCARFFSELFCPDDRGSIFCWTRLAPSKSLIGHRVLP